MARHGWNEVSTKLPKNFKSFTQSPEILCDKSVLGSIPRQGINKLASPELIAITAGSFSGRYRWGNYRCLPSGIPEEATPLERKKNKPEIYCVKAIWQNASTVYDT